MTLLDAEGRSRFAATCPDWDLDGETIRRTFVLADFSEATGFVVRVAMLSEVADHHPDIDIRWNKVAIALTTHDQGGLTQKDATLAAAIDGIEPS